MVLVYVCFAGKRLNLHTVNILSEPQVVVKNQPSRQLATKKTQKILKTYTLLTAQYGQKGNSLSYTRICDRRFRPGF